MKACIWMKDLGLEAKTGEETNVHVGFIIVQMTGPTIQGTKFLT